MKKRVVITGGTGFIGANLVRRLLRDGHEIHLFVRQKYSSWRIKSILKKIILHELYFKNDKSLISLFKQIKPHWIFHLATFGAYSNQNDIHKMIQTNISFTTSLLDSAISQGFEVFVNTGSSSEYGFNSNQPKEYDKAEPNSDYAITKLTATNICQHRAKTYKVYIPTLRLYSVYGPYEEPTRLIPTLIVNGFENQLPALVDPKISRDFVYVEDVCDAYIKVTHKRTDDFGPIYNVGSGVQTSLNVVVSIAKSEMNLKAKPVWKSFPNRKWDMNRWRSNNKKTTEELDWKVKYPFRKGFKKTIKWLQGNDKILKFYKSRVFSPSSRKPVGFKPTGG